MGNIDFVNTGNRNEQPDPPAIEANLENGDQQHYGQDRPMSNDEYGNNHQYD